MATQKIALEVREDQYGSGFEGQQFNADEMRTLGLEEGTNHVKIEFDNENSAKYCFCKAFFMFSVTLYGIPVFLLTFPCVWYNVNKWAESRMAAVTDHVLVLKEGWYAFYCCCWNERIKTVPLDKVTDLRLEQGCCQKCFDIFGIEVETPSASKQQSEMSLLGLHRPQEIRSMILKVRDQNGLGGMRKAMPQAVAASSGMGDVKAVEVLVTQQHETFVEIKDVLQDMRTALQDMDKKMDSNKL